ncbi:hypothetical protein JHK85_007713 [Glycine max]|nr:hypothetical protein JHK85_007713 [Glycine max]
MDSLSSINGDFGFDGGTDRRFAFSRQASFQQPHTPIDIPAHGHYDHHHYWSPRNDKPSAASLQRSSLSSFVFSVFRSVRSGHRYMKRLFLIISLNVAYSTAELLTGLFTGRVGLVSDAVHLTFGCGLLTFSLFVMAASRKKADREYTYGNAEDMNNHSVFLHVVADSIRRVQNAEVLCLGLVSVAVFMLVLPLFRATGGILLQMAPPSIPTTALNKCLRQISAREDVMEVSQARFWELLPGHVFGSLIVQVKKGTNDRPILEFVHGLFHDLGVQDLTVQTDDA